MYGHPATQANVRRLRDEFGYLVLEPEAGPSPRGQAGMGGSPDLERVVDAVVAAIGSRPVRQPDPAPRPPVVTGARPSDLEGRHIVVTAGGTAEPIDPVRFIGNRSTGKMGVAIAEAALARGARVTVIAGMTSVPLPAEAHVVRAESTAQMRAALLSTLVGGDGRPGSMPW